MSVEIGEILVTVSDERSAQQASLNAPPPRTTEAQEALRLRARLSRESRNRRRLVAT